jgi:hypothetical protein
VTPSGGFAAAVSLACVITTSIASPNDPPTCSIPASVSITESSAATATLTVNTTAATSAALRYPLRRKYAPAGGILFAIALFIGIPLRRRRWSYLAALLAVTMSVSILGCGGSTTPNTKPGNAGTTAGSYVVTITGTSAGVTTQTTTVNVTVN